MQYIDLRSDTVTLPTTEMRKAMANAELGDDVYGEDPTINQLQEKASKLLGKEAGLFVPSGTMGNLAAILAHCQRGDEVILGALSHTFLFEAGGISALGGVHSHQIPNQPDGTLALEDINNAIRPVHDDHVPVSRLLTLENTHNRCGGVALSIEYSQAAANLAHANDLFVHMDGARIFNASIALGRPTAELVADVDSVTFCLSKALCAPVGSVLCGSEEFIRRAHRVRKQLGGGMRQAGVLAAAGVIALDCMIDRLAEDHARARTLAEELSNIPGLKPEYGPRATNMVFLNLEDALPIDARKLASELRNAGILVGVVGSRRFRLVTHYWINDHDIEMTVKTFTDLLKLRRGAG